MSASSPSTTTKIEPGDWFVRIHHKALGGVRDFSSVHKPGVRFADAGRAFVVTVDENLYVFPVDGLYFVWRAYSPREGEEAPLADLDEVVAPPPTHRGD